MPTAARAHPYNIELLANKLAAFDRQPGPRVGDYLQLPNVHPKLGQFTRFTHHWGDTIQTGGLSGDYFLSAGGHLFYSGILDSGVSVSDIMPEPTGTRAGSVWFFNQDLSGAGRGVDYTAPMRLFSLRPGADLSGIGEIRCPFHLSALDQEQHARTCNYWFTVTKGGISHIAFTTREQLQDWMVAEGLELTHALPATPGTSAHQSLCYANATAL
jgi:hypothetical protein